jgi:hypothetical protein
MIMFRHRKPESTPPADEPLKVKKIVEKRVVKKHKPVEKPLTPSEPTIPQSVLDALSRIDTKLDALIKKDAEVHKQIEKPPFVSAEYPYDDACIEAQRISADLHCVQHVNRVKENVYKIDDFFDEDTTEISFENGKEL